jgi:hypothetical protein
MPAPKPSPAPGDPRAMVWDLIRGPWQFAATLALAQLGCFELLASGRCQPPAWPASATQTQICWNGCCAAPPAPGCWPSLLPEAMP